MLALTACVGAPPIAAAAGACSELLPADWRVPVPGADIPAGLTIGEWIKFADAQTGQLDKANERTTASLGIIGRCEARDRKAIDDSRKKWWQFWR